jgi:hypothetical protein
MPPFEKQHNANLSTNVPDSKPVVNFYDNMSGTEVFVEERCPDKLFVGICNSVINLQLKPRLLEFYCLMCYLIFAYPTKKLSILRIQSLIVHYTNYKPSKDTINKYLNILLSLNLIYKNGYYYSNKPWSEFDSANKNKYIRPKRKYTWFYITIYNNNTKPGTMALELYMASKLYNYHRLSKVCNDLAICLKTYYYYLSQLVTKKVVLRSRVNRRKYYYIHKHRAELKSNYEYIRQWRYYSNKIKWEKRIQSNCKTRRWYASPMGKIMKDYKINYIPAFNNYDPMDAYDIVLRILKQYGGNVTTSLIVRGILDGYDWVKIVDERHAEIKKLSY